MIFLCAAFLGCAAIAAVAFREHRHAMGVRRSLLDEAIPLLMDSRMELAADHHPVVSGFAADGRRVTLDLVSDTMVTRRLPQLWLRVTVHNEVRQPWPSVGVLARPTGSEYYSTVHGLAHWLRPPPSAIPLLMRGDLAAQDERWSDLTDHLASLVADTRIKEAVVSPGAIRVIVQAAEGDRAAHVLLRQARFAIGSVPAQTIHHALELAATLRSVASDTATQSDFQEKRTA